MHWFKRRSASNVLERTGGVDRGLAKGKKAIRGTFTALSWRGFEVENWWRTGGKGKLKLGTKANG
jgi:hypothetical protein